jgi:hypothetical protein
MIAVVLLTVALALAAAGCGGGGSRGSSEADRVEQLLYEYTSTDAVFEPEQGQVEFTDCRPLEDVEHEGRPAFYCEYGNDQVVAGTCVARIEERLYFSGGRLPCEDPFELTYRPFPLESEPGQGLRRSADSTRRSWISGLDIAAEVPM